MSHDRVRDRVDEIERVLNWVSDQDREWWPFLFVRPGRAQRMTSTRVALLAVLYGTFAGMLANAAIALTTSERPALSVVTLPSLASIGFFALFRATFAVSWNRRAKRLSAAAERRG
jgi:hypothetical protein